MRRMSRTGDPKAWGGVGVGRRWTKAVLGALAVALLAGAAVGGTRAGAVPGVHLAASATPLGSPDPVGPGNGGA